MSSRGKVSAGLLVYRRRVTLEVLLVHPGGPFWKNKDDGAWSIPKGETEASEDLLAAAQRELFEETGYQASGPFMELIPVRQKSGKLVHAWACEGDLDPSRIHSNTFSLEWPPRSGKLANFPEVDRADFFDVATAKNKINSAQTSLLDELVRRLG